MNGKQKRIIVAISAVIAVICIVGLIWWAESSWSVSRQEVETETASSSSSSDSTSFRTSSDTTTTSTADSGKTSSAGESSVNSASTSQTKSDANDPGDGVARDSSSAAATTGKNGKLTAQVLLTWWDAGTGSISANGSVNNLIENGGTCTLSASRGSLVRKVSNSSIANATTTVCGELTIPASQLSAGDWKIQLSYVSGTASGSSSTQTVHID